MVIHEGLERNAEIEAKQHVQSCCNHVLRSREGPSHYPKVNQAVQCSPGRTQARTHMRICDSVVAGWYGNMNMPPRLASKALQACYRRPPPGQDLH